MSNKQNNEFYNLIDSFDKNYAQIDKMLYLENKTFSVNHNLNYTDKLSMKAGVEVRVPFLDLDVIKFAFSLDPKFKINNGTTKYVLREYAKLFLSNKLIYRSKSGFGSPVREWVKNTNRDFKEVDKLINDNEKNAIDASYSIWALMAVQSWHNQFVK